MKSMSGFGGGVASLSMKSAGGGGGIVTNNLVLHLDAGNSSSYSGSGATWTDLSGQGNNGTINGSTYNSEIGGYFDFDGSNDYVSLGTSINSYISVHKDCSFNIWMQFDIDSRDNVIITHPTIGSGNDRFLIWYDKSAFGTPNNTGGNDVGGGTTNIITVHVKNTIGGEYRWTTGNNVFGNNVFGNNTTNTWHNICVVLDTTNDKYYTYLNGQQVALFNSTAVQGIDSRIGGVGQDFYIGRSNNSHNSWLDGKLSQFLVYSKALSSSEVLQNYNATKGRYTGIITDNLVLNLDAGDSSSYSGSGNTWTDLSSSNNDGTINGATYNSGNGGYFDFDGSNDSISFTLSNDFAFGTGDFTIEAWVRFDNTGDGGTIAETRENAVGTGKNGLGFGMRSNRITIWSGVTNTFIIDKTLSLSLDAWHHVIVSRSSGTLKSYINTVEETSSSNTHNFTRRNLFIGRNINDASTGGTAWGNQDQALLRIYKGKGFSASEVQQNFNATKSRYTGLVTDNLVLHLDAGDINSYSGSGTTWTDLSGEGNHATLINNPTYSSNNGGYLNFDGSNDYATLPAINFTGNEITFSIWTYAQSDTVAALIFFGDSTDTSGWTGRQLNVHLPYTNSYYFDKGHDGTTVDRISGSLPNSDWQNAWVNWAFTANASTGSMKIYRNASLYNSATGKTRTFNSANVDIRRIARFTNTYYDGYISNLQLYTKELSQAEVTQNFNTIKSRFGL